MTAAGLPAGAGNRIVAGGTTTTWGELEPLDLPPAAAVLVAVSVQPDLLLRLLG